MKALVAGVVLACLATPAAAAEDIEPGNVSGWVTRRGLTGEWLGGRGRLLERGVDVVLVYTGETWTVADGGHARDTTYLDNVDLALITDLERLLGWPGASATVYGLGNHGGSPSADVGDAQRVSNVDAPDAWKLYEAWLEQRLPGDRVSLRVGLQNLNAEFYVNEASGVFLHSAFGMGHDFAQSGRNGPSIFPVTSVAARLRGRPTRATYAQVAVLDGVPGDPRKPDGTQIAWRDEDGLLLVGEVGWTSRHDDAPVHAKLAAGAWGYTTALDTVASVAGGRPERARGSHGAYALGELAVWQETADPAQGAAVFVRGGWADPRFNPFGGSLGAGAVYTGLVPTRDVDRLGLGVATAFGGSDLRRAARRAGALGVAETAVELTYRLELTPWLALQPAVTWVVDPGLARSVRDALAVALRVRVLL